MEIRSPCNSSSQTFWTAPAFPSVSTTALPINSDCAAPYSFKIFDARRFTDGIARLYSAEPSVPSKAVQRRRLVPTLSRWGLQFAQPVDSRSKAPGAFRLFFQDRAQSLPDLLNDCSTMFGVYVYAGAHHEASFGLEGASIVPAGNSERNRSAAVVCASAYFLRTAGPAVGTIGYPRMRRVVNTGSRF
jgi:hypothetical protein